MSQHHATACAALLLCLALATQGCASLEIHSSDSGGAKTAKILGRTVLGIATLGISEVEYAQRRRAAERRAALDSWIGHSVDDLIARLGPPTTVTRGQDSVFYTWTRSLQHTTAAPTRTKCTTPYGSNTTKCKGTTGSSTTYTISSSTTFRVNRRGVITGWSTR